AARGGRRGGAAAEPLKVLGAHPEGGEVQVMPGRYGPYVKWEKVNATLPKDLAPEEVTLEQALELIAGKAAKGARSLPARLRQRPRPRQRSLRRRKHPRKRPPRRPDFYLAP